MMVRERISGLWKKKKVRYTAAGTVCLVLAAGLLVMVGNGTGAKAAATEITGLQKDGQGRYQITDGADFSLLRDANVDASASFVLTQDIELAVTDTADGVFLGCFDGDGHVIKVTSVNIPESAEAGTVSQGLLFGTVKGSVTNLIVDVQAPVDYTRTSKVERTADIVSDETEANETAQPSYSNTGKSISIYEGSDEEKKLAAALDKSDGKDIFYQLADGTITTEKPADEASYTEYRREAISEEVVNTITYQPGMAGNDAFGVLCGTLDEGASLNQIYVKGTTVNVTQNGTGVSMTTTQNGTRDHYFYYKKDYKDIAASLTVPSEVSVTAGAVNVYSSGAAAAANKSDDILDLKVSVPKYIEKGNTLSYTVNVTNKSAHTLTVTLEPSQTIIGGAWTVTGGNSVDFTNGVALAAGSSMSYTYQLSSAVRADTTGSFKASYSYTTSEPKEVAVTGVITESVDFKAAYTKVTENSGAVSLDSVSTKVISTSEEGAATSTPEGELLLSLKPAYMNYMTADTADTSGGTDTSDMAEVQFELQITNNGTKPEAASDLQLTVTRGDITDSIKDTITDSVTADNIVWYEKNTTGSDGGSIGNEFTEATLGSGKSITLIGIMQVSVPEGEESISRTLTVGVAPSKSEAIYSNVAHYTYADTLSGDLATAPQYSEVHYGDNQLQESSDLTDTGNHLSAGIFAGFSKGSITECKQEVSISGTQNANVPSDVALQTGGAAGTASEGASASSLYLKGTGTYVGNSQALPESSVNASSASKPSADTWASYTVYNTGLTAEEFFDLSWLVKDGGFSYGSFSDSGSSSNQIPVTAENAARALTSYAIAYNARKAITDTSEENIYLAFGTSGTMALDIGNSGYYRILNAYATDGYYHYRSDAKVLSDAAYIYPYRYETTSDPYADLEWNVVRIDANTAEDVIRVTGFSDTWAGGLLYYIKNTEGIPTDQTSSKPESITGGQADLPFDEDQVSYRIAAMVNGHVYPAFPALTESAVRFDTSDREPLAKPVMIYQSGYTADGEEAYKEFTGNASLEVGDKLKISSSDTENEHSYTYKYLLSEEVLGGDSWEDGIYTGEENLMANAQNYNTSVTVPKEGVFHVYVQVSRKNYKDQIYEMGTLNVAANSEVFLDVYYTEKSISGIKPGESVVDGDLLKLACDGKKIKYDMSYTEKTSGYNWKEYTTDSFLTLTQSGSSDKVYIYVALASDENEYDSIESFSYSFADNCAAAAVTPNTAQETEGTTGAASIESGSKVSLSSRTSGAVILYTQPESNTDFTVERVTDIPSSVAASGDVAGGYAYYQSGGRWYRTNITDLKTYSESIMLSHTDSSSKFMRIYAVSFCDGYEPGAVRKYVYSVAAPQKVADPEASLKTRKADDSSDVAVTNIELGAKLTFPSMTPEAAVWYKLPGESVWKEAPEGGIEVTGTYNTKFTISVQAKKEGMLDSDIVTYEYMILEQETTNAPTATPATAADNPTVVIPGNKILLSSTTKGAVIYYTIDGTSPQLATDDADAYLAAEGTLVYDPEVGITMPDEGSGFFTIRAVAAKDGLAKSSEVQLVYTYPDEVLAPYASVAQGKVALNTEVHLKNKTADAVIYYNIAYGENVPEEPAVSSPVYDKDHPFTITRKTTIRAVAVKDGIKSDSVTLVYIPMDLLAAPTASVESGSVVSRGTVLTLEAEKGATIYYTTDGSDPLDGTNKSVVTGSSIVLNGDAGSQITIKAYAAADDRSQSDVVTFTYQFSQSAGGVTADVASGSEVSNGSKVNLMTDVTDADIYYTTDGSDPAWDGTKGTAVTINGTPGSAFTIKAVAVVDGDAGVVSSFTYKIKDVPNAPTAMPSGGTLTIATRVTLASSSEKIYYTTDGTMPTESSALYAEPILINRTTTLKAIAVSGDGEISEVMSWQYVAAAKVSAPKANMGDQDVLEPGTVVMLRTDTSGAKIYYSTDGTTPDLDNLDDMLEYQEDGITVNRSVTVKAVAYREDMQISDVSSWNYVVEKIPAVEWKEQEAARLEEEGLRDSDSTKLARSSQEEGPSYASRVLRETTCNTVVSSAWESINPLAVLVTEELETSSASINNAKKLFGDDYTVLASYDMKLMVGSTYIKPAGEVEIGIPIPEGYEHATLTIAHVDSEHRLKTYTARRTDDMLYAMTDQMDQYVVIGLEDLNAQSSGIPYLLILEIAAGITLFAGLVYLIREKIKKYLRNC